MTTQPPPESAEPAPAVVKTECWCARCSQQHRFLSFSTVMIVCPNCGNKRCPRAEWHGFVCSGSNESGQVGVPAPVATDTQARECECDDRGMCLFHQLEDSDEPITPAPAGDAEVSHEQARGCVQLLSGGTWSLSAARKLGAYVDRCEARQQQAERDAAEGLRLVKELRASAQQASQRIAEYKASEADWRESLRAAQSVLQGKDEVIAELKARVEEEDTRAVEWMDKADELSRRLEAAEREVEQMRARVLSTDRYRCKQVRVSSNAPGLPTYIRCGKHSGHDMGHDFSGAVETSDPVAPIQECAPPDQPPPAKPLTRDDDLVMARRYFRNAGHDYKDDAEASSDAMCAAIGHILNHLEAQKPLTRDDDCPPGGHPASVYASENGDTLSFPGSQFLTVRACVDCGVLINGGPTRCLTCADKPLTPDDVRSIARAVVAEVAERAAGLPVTAPLDRRPLHALADAAKEES